MHTEEALTEAMTALMIRGDVAWLALRVPWTGATEDGGWLDEIEIPAWFFTALKGVSNGPDLWTIRTELASHELEGDVKLQYVQRRMYLEWNVAGSTPSPDGIVAAFMIFATRPGHEQPLWCWICETIEEEEYAESVFNWWPPQRFAYARGLPFFPKRVGL